MSRNRLWLVRCVLILLAGHAVFVAASSLVELQESGRLQLDSSLAPAEGIVPGQKVRLTLKIATDRWFSGGTRINIPEVSGLIILQTEQFASNASEIRDGQSWVVQRWTLDVFPQRSGDFTIPPMQLQVKINAGDTGDVEGTLLTAAAHFSATVPDELARAEHWVAAPEFEVRQSFDRSLEGLQVGDAFEREIVFEASDVMAMMLPAFSPDKQPGLASYPSPPVLNNSGNRGQAAASRSQRISYIVEAQGQYLLPAQDYFWWDTGSKQLQLIALPATDISVGSGSTTVLKSTTTDLDITPRQLLIFIAGLALLALVLRLAWKFLPRSLLAKFRALLTDRWHQLKALRKPALPEQLNPGSSAGE